MNTTDLSEQVSELRWLVSELRSELETLTTTPYPLAHRFLMRGFAKRLIAVRSQLRRLGCEPHPALPFDEVLKILDELSRAEPELVASHWYQQASDHQISQLRREWSQQFRASAQSIPTPGARPEVQLIEQASSLKMAGWFVGRQEVQIIDFGTSDKQGLGFIMVKWRECEMDPLFLALLRDEELVGDDTVYSHNLEG